MDRKKIGFLILALHNFQGRNAMRRKHRHTLLLYLRFMNAHLPISQFIPAICAALPMARRYWMTDYDQDWFTIMWEKKDETIYKELWLKEFRMSPDTFCYIVGVVRATLLRQNTSFRNAIPIEKRVVMTIWRLSTENSYRTVGKVFGVGISCSIINEFCSSITAVASDYIKFPQNGQETANEIQKFKSFTDCAIPQVVAAIDGTHIEILTPEGDSRLDYFSRKQRYTINTQAIVGANLMFLDIATGYPGSMHDARILRSTTIYHKAEAEEILATPYDVLNGVKVRPILLGDGAYPSTTWQVKPYPMSVNLTQSEKDFNKLLSSARVTVERGFGLLKARWRCVLKRLDNKRENLVAVIVTCCVLHNICQERKESYIDDNDVLQLVISQERRAARNRLQNHQVYHNAETLRDTLKDIVV